ncbi:hypothetical protein [Viridibacterium curvum]|uniref:Uncharacterized protein n=1 Tax=Viridibacterium curvum TaxID=1101404 RepID=A0ABP9QW71_9RHOO
MTLPTRCIVPALICLLLAACAIDYKARPDSAEGIRKAQPVIEKLLAYKNKHGLFPAALNDVGESRNDLYYQPEQGGSSYLVSFDYHMLAGMIRCERTFTKDWACVRI